MTRKLERITKSCGICGRPFQCVAERNQRYCSVACARVYTGEKGKEYIRIRYAENSSDAPPDYAGMDAKFCKAMVKAGYKMTGPDKTPGTDNPIDTTRGRGRGAQSSMADYESW